MENDTQLYQSQLEAKKKMQVDLEKELQSSFNEITKLTSLIDGKVPKGILSFQTYLFANLSLYRTIPKRFCSCIPVIKNPLFSGVFNCLMLNVTVIWYQNL